MIMINSLRVCHCDHDDTISENMGSGHYMHYHHEMWTVFAQSGAGRHIAFSFIAPNGIFLFLFEVHQKLNFCRR